MKVLSILTIFLMTVVVFGGALVTKTGSADGCGATWPLCEGQLVNLTDVTLEKLIEVFHRLSTGLASIFVILLAVLSWKYVKDRKETKIIVITSVVFLILQAFMGAMAVVWGQNAIIMALHFGISIISYASIVMLGLFIFEIDMKFDAKSVIMHKKSSLQYLLSNYFHLYRYLYRSVGSSYGCKSCITLLYVRRRKICNACNNTTDCSIDSPRRRVNNGYLDCLARLARLQIL